MMIFIDQFSPILSDIRFDNGWFLRKYQVKEEIFKNRINKYDIKNTYGEINERIIRETKNYAHSSIQRNVAVCLQTNLFIGHLHYYLMNKLKRMKQFLSGHDIFKK